MSKIKVRLYQIRSLQTLSFLGQYQRGYTQRYLIYFVLQKYKILRLVVTSPRTLLLVFRQHVLRYIYLDLSIFFLSLQQLKRIYLGILVLRQVVYTLAFSLKNAYSKSYIISPFIRRLVSYLAISQNIALTQSIRRLKCFYIIVFSGVSIIDLKRSIKRRPLIIAFLVQPRVGLKRSINGRLLIIASLE